ncbi:MAG TPA: phasin family protein [Gemmatimonadales bacterium]|nr:phasin family protein [Gemmatimonadales bacterium]
MTKAMKTGKRAPAVREAAEHIYLAGLGAFALAEEEGTRVFENLVKKGKNLDKMNKARVQKLLTQVEGKVGNAREGAGHTFGRLTAPIDAGVTTALHRLGVPTRKEIALLTRRVEELTKSVEKNRTRRPAPRRRAHRTTRKAGAEMTIE